MPTGCGKTEAAVFPLLSRMLSEDWRGLTVLYVCPLRALLNNLAVRLGMYGQLLGRTAELWHGDVRDAARRKILEEPPDILLITPESLEVILTLRRQHTAKLFGDVRAVVVDEVHAFAGDDRGWHVLAILERIFRDIQRLGLSATVGEPASLLDWLAGSSAGPRRASCACGESSRVSVTVPYTTSASYQAVSTVENASPAPGAFPC